MLFAEVAGMSDHTATADDGSELEVDGPYDLDELAPDERAYIEGQLAGQLYCWLCLKPETECDGSCHSPDKARDH